MNGHLLEVTIHAGPQAGQRVRVHQSPAAFGRDAGNALVIDLPTVSRVHGELRLEGGRWVLVNVSPNGTTLNRKTVGRKPRPLTDGDSVVIGDQAVMSITLREGGEAIDVTKDNLDATPEAQRRAPLTPRAKLWLSIFGFWAVVFVLAFVFIGLGGEDTGNGNHGGVPTLDDAAIAAAIRAPLREQEPSPRNAARHLDEAQANYQLIAADPKYAFDALIAYKTALSYARGDAFNDPRDDWSGHTAAELAIAQNRYRQLEQRLIEDVTRLYKDAVGKLSDRRYGEAKLAFERVFRLYDDPRNEVHRNALQQRDLARRLQDRQP
ncbi:MAG: FHA domain-containing protein [Planctomycetota bacterium]